MSSGRLSGGRRPAQKRIPKAQKSIDLEHFWAPDGFGQDLAADALPRNVRKALIWSTFELQTALARTKMQHIALVPKIRVPGKRRQNAAHRPGP